MIVPRMRALAVIVFLAPAAAYAAEDELPKYGVYRPYVGFDLAADLPGVWFDHTAGVGGELALRVGAISRDVQIEVSLSPGSSFLANALSCCTTNAPPIVFFRGDVSVAYLIKVSDLVYWPLRLGVGAGVMLAPQECYDCGPTTPSTTLGFVQLKVEGIGVLIRTSKRFMVEMQIPSTSLFLVPTGSAIVEWNTTLGMAYVF